MQYKFYWSLAEEGEAELENPEGTDFLLATDEKDRQNGIAAVTFSKIAKYIGIQLNYPPKMIVRQKANGDLWIGKPYCLKESEYDILWQDTQSAIAEQIADVIDGFARVGQSG